MGHHNILITNPKGERRHQFGEDRTREECKKWLKEYGPAPAGWMYQITNSHRRKRVLPESILLTGFSKDGDFIAQIKARHKTNYGWYTVRMAKRDLRKQGASYFTQEKVWANEQTSTT